MSIEYQKKRDKKEEKKEKDSNKPELTVRGCNKDEEINWDIQILVAKFDANDNINFVYPEEYKNKNEYIFKDFVFQNIGKTPIESLYIVSNYKKNISIFDIEFADEFMKEGYINYGCMWDKKIFPGDELKVRIYFHKNWIVTSNYSSAFFIQFQDSNNNCWEQALFEQNYNLYTPREISYKDYRRNISIEESIKCFEKPWLW